MDRIRLTLYTNSAVLCLLGNVRAVTHATVGGPDAVAVTDALRASSQEVETQEARVDQEDAPVDVAEGSASAGEGSQATEQNAGAGTCKDTMTAGPPAKPRDVEIGEQARELMLDGEALPDELLAELVVLAVLDVQRSFDARRVSGGAKGGDGKLAAKQVH